MNQLSYDGRVAPQPSNVQRLTTALFAVLGNMNRARKNIPDAATLAVLQVIGAVEQAEPGRGVRPSEIAGRLDVHRSAVTHHLAALTRAGHITARTDPADRRSSLLFLTDAGQAVMQQLTRHGQQRFASFVADWSDEEVATLAALLEKFLYSAAAVNAKQPPPSAPDWKTALPPD
jgi:DNA-binding MarR family transcriptional regulator